VVIRDASCVFLRKSFREFANNLINCAYFFFLSFSETHSVLNIRQLFFFTTCDFLMHVCNFCFKKTENERLARHFLTKTKTKTKYYRFLPYALVPGIIYAVIYVMGACLNTLHGFIWENAGFWGVKMGENGRVFAFFEQGVGFFLKKIEFELFWGGFSAWTVLFVIWHCCCVTATGT
jgi:hypothetical protein